MIEENIAKSRQKALKILIERERELNFPQFLKVVRKLFGISREYVACHSHISPWQLYRWESGEFKRSIHVSDLLGISDYYGIPFKLLTRKMMDYVTNQELDK